MCNTCGISLNIVTLSVNSCCPYHCCPYVCIMSNSHISKGKYTLVYSFWLHIGIPITFIFKKYQNTIFYLLENTCGVWLPIAAICLLYRGIFSATPPLRLLRGWEGLKGCGQNQEN